LEQLARRRPETGDQAKAFQKAWADYFKVPVEWENSIGMKFVLIPPGEFMMGSSEAEIVESQKLVHPDYHCLLKQQRPQHRIVLQIGG